MRRHLLCGVVVAALLLVPATTAQAAPSLVGVVPANGAVVTERPEALVLTFSEDLGSAEVDLGDEVVAAVDVDGPEVRVRLEDPPPGTARDYVAAYVVTSVEGIRVRGEVGFTVDPTAQPSEPVEDRWGGLLAALVVAALALTLWTTLRRWSRARGDGG